MMSNRPPAYGPAFELKWHNRLAVRIAAGVLLVTAAGLGMVGWLTAVQEERLFQEAHGQSAQKISAIIAARIAERMMAGGGHSAWTNVIEEASRLGRETGTLRILVLSTTGEVKAGSDVSVGNAVIKTSDNPECPGCDGKEPTDFPVAKNI